MTTAGTAFVDIRPQVAKSFGTETERGVGSALGGIAGVAAKAVAGVTLAIAGVGAAVVGLAIKGGISRSLNIEDAQAKLKGLGHDTMAIEAIMDSALASVRGTAFGLDAAATAAANAVAAGIDPGEELTRVLSLTGDAATIMGRDFNESGAIVNKVLASNRVTMREVNQLHAAGLPILQMLADEYGVTAAEMSDMVSSGVVDSEAFLNAIETNIGGAALAGGETTRGAFANMGAAMSRWGEVIVKPLLPLVRNVFLGITATFDRLTDAAKPMMASFADSGVFKRLENASKNIPATFDKITAAVSPLIERAVHLFGVFREGEGFADKLRGVFASMAQTSGPALAGMFSSLLEALQSVFTNIVNWLASGGITQILDTILAARVRLLDAALQLFPAILEAAVTFLPSLLNFIAKELIPKLLEYIVKAVPDVLSAALELFTSLVDALVEVVPTLISTLLGDVLPNILETVLSMVPDLLTTAITAFLALVDAILKILPTLVSTLLGTVLPRLLTTILSMVPDLLRTAVTTFLALVTAVLEVLPELITVLLAEVLPALTVAIIDMAPDILIAAVEAFMQIAHALSSTIPELVHTLGKEMLPALVEAMNQGGQAMYDAGAKAMQRLWDGIKAVGRKAVDWVRDNVVGAIKKLWPFSPAKEGPFAGKGSPFHAGRNIMGQFAKGLEKGTGGVLAAAEGMTEAVSALTTYAPSNVGGSAASGSGMFGNLTVNTTGDAEVLAREILWRTNWAEAVAGRA